MPTLWNYKPACHFIGIMLHKYCCRFFTTSVSKDKISHNWWVLWHKFFLFLGYVATLLSKGSKMDVYEYKHYWFHNVQWHLFIIFIFHSITARINRCRMDWNREEYTWDFKVCIYLVSLMHDMGMYLLCSHFPWCSQWYLPMHYIVDKVRNKYDNVRGISASLCKFLRCAYGL